MKRITIQDANILLDLVKTGLFDHCLALPFQFITTSIILDELYPGQIAIVQPHINSGKFTVQEITGEELEAINLLTITNTHLSEQDWSAYYFAEKLNALLLTGDKRLKAIADKKGIEAHGILWLPDMLVDTTVLAKKDAHAFLEALVLKNKRLPAHECE